MAVWVHVEGLGEDPLLSPAVRNGEDHPNNLGLSSINRVINQ